MGLCTSVCKRNEDLQFTDMQREGYQDALEEILPTEEPLYINLQWDGRRDIPEEITTISKEDELYIGFKEDLITHYRQNESELVAVPLVDEHKVPIEALYVLPPMWVYDNPCNFSKITQKGDKTLGKDTQLREQMCGNDALKRTRATIAELFVCRDNVRYKKIYVTANAGFGKTSLSQKLTMTWCQTHSPLESLTEKYKDTELEAMQYFDLLFLVHLRDYQSEAQCNLDDLIIKMISTYMSRKLMYTNEFIEKILHEKKCLVILDGLDEWSHPGHCRRKPEVPHNNHPESCTVLTTTRDWKLGTIGLSPNHIDRRVEISEFDWLSRWSLETNAILILNENNLNFAGKDQSDFDKELRSVHIKDIVLIPFILLQLIFLFFGGYPIGTSKCEIYSNITEFTLERGLNKNNLSDLQETSNDNPAVPNCMKNNKTCKRYFSLLMKLGKLAFFTLFNDKKESSLTFDSIILSQYMISEEVEFCLKFGLFNQTKERNTFAVKRYNVSFQHKSVQEFFSAIHITSEWRNEQVKTTVLKACSSLSSVLEMSNVFIFVCGMNPEVYTCISGELQKVVESDSFTSKYRTGMHISYDETETIKSFQTMQMQCVQESVRNGFERCSVSLQDILLARYSLTQEEFTIMKFILNSNKGKVKSLHLQLCKENDTFMLSLDSGIFTSLETFRIECYEEPVWLANVLTESTHTLKCLKISGISTIFNICIKALTGLTNLNLLYLYYVTMTHSNLEHLYAYIRQTTTLTQLKQEKLYCSIHKDQDHDCVITLDLHRLNQLKILDLDQVPCRELNINPACLEKLWFPSGTRMTASASSSLWDDLRGAPVLSLLDLSNMSSCQEMFQTIPTLTKLQYLELAGIDMDAGTPDFVSTMTHLKHVGLNTVAMSFSKWRQLFISISKLSQSVTVDIQFCEGPSVEEWKDIVDMIKSTPSLSLTQELNINSESAASLTLEKL